MSSEESSVRKEADRLGWAMHGLLFGHQNPMEPIITKITLKQSGIDWFLVLQRRTRGKDGAEVAFVGAATLAGILRKLEDSDDGQRLQWRPDRFAERD